MLLGHHLRERSVSPTSGEHHTDYIAGKLVLQTTMVDIVNLIKLYVWVNVYRFCENKHPLVLSKKLYIFVSLFMIKSLGGSIVSTCTPEFCSH